jgi:hypothetical protein
MPDVIYPAPPLARLIQGGRGGGTRLPLYLLLTMIATRKPFDIRKPLTPVVTTFGGLAGLAGPDLGGSPPC